MHSVCNPISVANKLQDNWALAFGIILYKESLATESKNLLNR